VAQAGGGLPHSMSAMVWPWCAAPPLIRLSSMYRDVSENFEHDMGHRYPRCSQLTYTKQCYRVRNWPQYEAGLRRRGDVTPWFSEEAIAAWLAPTGGTPGAQLIYSDHAIKAALTVRLMYGLPLRQTEGFLRSISSLHESGYTRCSLVETTMSRYKTIIGGSMRSRTMPSQKTEIAFACAILNRRTHLGMPYGYCIA
jgi:hypothetical protein